MERLTAAIEASSLIRRAEAAGGFGAVLKKGDADRGSLLLVITSRGEHFACLERVSALDGKAAWHAVGPPQGASSPEIGEFLAKRARFDPDSWLIELDVALAERFIAETTSEG